MNLATDVLVAAATAVVVLRVFLAVHYAVDSDSIPGFSVADVVAEQIVDALWQAGMLLGLALLVRARADEGRTAG